MNSSIYMFENNFMLNFVLTRSAEPQSEKAHGDTGVVIVAPLEQAKGRALDCSCGYCQRICDG